MAAITLVGCAQPSTESSKPPVAEPARWSCDGASGPASWAELDPGFAACGVGNAQSPIDLPATVPAPSSVIQLSAEDAEADVFDTGHAVEFEADGEGETLTFAGDE
ncbi:carbonic anhydrase family protein [Cryobacterium sp. TMT1-19]|uniref:carbonic anhydrase family protein n=1 Tax=Cryobacterium sp. TMT1-19 TaxID=1259231 RepID=UPI00141A808D|nr:carbonic anhydrase family protein [Cryobacterium sp. TMT1-19]